MSKLSESPKKKKHPDQKQKPLLVRGPGRAEVAAAAPLSLREMMAVRGEGKRESERAAVPKAQGLRPLPAQELCGHRKGGDTGLGAPGGAHMLRDRGDTTPRTPPS